MAFWRDFRRLPPLLRGLRVAAILLLLTDIALLVPTFLTAWSSFATWPSLPQLPAYVVRVPGIAVNLGLLSLACSSVVTVYSLRFRQPAREPFPLASWQSQLRTFALLAALPLWGLALALLISPTFPDFYLVGGVDVLAMFVGLATLLTTYIREQVLG